MPTTTSLKLPDALKSTIAQVAAFEGKTSHALMVETLQAAMDDALARQQFYAEGEASYQDTLRSNTVYHSADVKAFITARVKTTKAAKRPVKPKAQPLHAAKPLRIVQN